LIPPRKALDLMVYKTISDIAAQSAMVIETNNLRGGGGGLFAAVQSLERLLCLLQTQTLPLTFLAEVIITHDGIAPEVCARLQAKYPFQLKFVTIDQLNGYYSAKNLGFLAVSSKCRYVVFADSDCIPTPPWLEQLLQPFMAEPDLAVVAGRTTYQDSLFGAALSTIDFKYYPNPKYPNSTRNFYANNVVFQRDVFTKFAYPTLDKTYRGHCQVLGLALEQAGVEMRYVSRAHTIHRLPDTFKELLQLRWLRGQDTCSLTPFLVKRHLPKWMQWFARTGPIAPLLILSLRLWFSLAALNHQDLTAQKGCRRFAAYIGIFSISALDMFGAFVRGLGWSALPQGNGDTLALSYHHATKENMD